MFVNQIAVFSENRQGRLLPIVKALGDAGVNIECLTIADTKEFGIVRMLTSDNQKAAKALADAGFMTRLTDLVGVEVDDKAGKLSAALKALVDGGIDVEYMYSYSRSNGKALILFKTDEKEKAQNILTEHNM